MLAATLPKNPYSVLDVRALFQLPPTSKHPWMGLSIWPHCLTTGNHTVPHQGTGGCPNASLHPWPHTMSMASYLRSQQPPWSDQLPWHHVRGDCTFLFTPCRFSFAMGCVHKGSNTQCLCKPGYAGPNCER